jgi:DNA-binding transcriptional ArsR family regulator
MWLTVVVFKFMLNHMVKHSPDMNAVFQALAHEARREMLGRLAASDLTVGELAAPLTMSLAAVSKHVLVLERAGLLRRTVTGRNHRCSLQLKPLASASSWLRFYEQFWNNRLDALTDVVQSRSKRRAAK